jgi:hypothetical protein
LASQFVSKWLPFCRIMKFASFRPSRCSRPNYERNLRCQGHACAKKFRKNETSKHSINKKHQIKFFYFLKYKQSFYEGVPTRSTHFDSSWRHFIILVNLFFLRRALKQNRSAVNPMLYCVINRSIDRTNSSLKCFNEEASDIVNMFFCEASQSITSQLKTSVSIIILQK